MMQGWLLQREERGGKDCKEGERIRCEHNSTCTEMPWFKSLQIERSAERQGDFLMQSYRLSNRRMRQPMKFFCSAASEMRVLEGRIEWE